MDHINLVCATTSPICLNTATLSDPNSLTLFLTSPLVCKSDYI